MSTDIKQELFPFLTKGPIVFSVHFVNKCGGVLEIEQNGTKNNGFGDIYERLSEWFNYEFMTYIDYYVPGYFDGYIELNKIFKDKVNICVSFHETCELVDRIDEIYIEEDVFRNILNIDLSNQGIKTYDECKLHLSFEIESNKMIESVCLLYHDEDNQIEVKLNGEQQSIIDQYVLNYVIKNAPNFEMTFISAHFDYSLYVKASCELGNTIAYDVSTSHIIFDLDDIKID